MNYRNCPNCGAALPAPPATAEESAEMSRSTFSQWFDERLVVVEGATTRAKDLYADYRQWCDQQGVERPLSLTPFGNALADRQIIRCGKDADGKVLRTGAQFRRDYAPTDRREG